MNARLALTALLLPFFTHNAAAQDAEHTAWIRTSTRSAIATFANAGARGLQASVEACYSGADKKTDFKSFFLEAERCTAMDQLGRIVFMDQKIGLEAAGRVVNDSFFNPIAQQKRMDAFWNDRQMNEKEKSDLIEKIYHVVYDESRKAAAAPLPVNATAKARPKTPAKTAAP